MVSLMRNGTVRNVQNTLESPYHLMEATRTFITMLTNVTERTQ